MPQPSDIAPQHSPTPKPAKSRLKRLATITLLALLAGTAAAGITFLCQPTQYQCTGMIRVRPVIQPILFNSPAIVPMYEQFVKTQMVILKNERSIEIAMANPRWLNNGTRTNSNDAVRSFEGHLNISSDGEIIRVRFRDPDPRTTSDAVAALIDAYQELTTSIDPEDTRDRKAILDELKTKYEAYLGQARQQISQLAAPYTPSALESRYNYKLTEANQAETEYQASLASLDNWKALHSGAGDAAVTSQEVTLDQLKIRVDLDKTRFDSIQAEANMLGSRVTQIDEIKASTHQTTQWLEETKQKLEEISVSFNSPSRISVLSIGDTPELIYSEKLPLSAGVGGGVFLATLIAAALLPRRRSVPS